MEREQLLSVTIEDTLFRSADGRFSVLRGSAEAAGPEPVILVGDLGSSSAGETLRVRGHYEQHGTYGRRLRVASFTPIIPSTGAGIARYLGSGLIQGVGPALAQRMIQRFGDRTLDIITTQSARLREVPGIGAQRAQAIAAAVRGRLDEAELMSFLQSLGLGPALSQRIRQRYGPDTARVVREDPYLAAEQVAGVGFRTADGMAQALGFAKDDPRRAAGAVLHLLGRAADDGHTFLPTHELGQQAQTLDVPEERLPHAVQELSSRELVQVDGDALYIPPLYRAEVRVAARLRKLAERRIAPGTAERYARTTIDDAQLAPAQRDAVRATFEESLLVVTGGPGTGKTTTVRAIVGAARECERRILLCAPTGRAAKRLSDASGADAHTIHRLLEWNPRSGTFGRDRDLPLETDLLLVDEASMLDVQLCHHLLEALPPSAALILVGDADQLPPVGPGPVLRELLHSGICRVVRLSEVFRQAQASTIVRAAHEVLNGHRPTPTKTGSRGPGDLFLIRARTPELVTTRLGEALDRMQKVYGLDPVRDVQVLSPMRRGPLGTEALNLFLQRRLNPDPRGEPAEPATRPQLRAGDKVMQLRNDYEREIWNGDVGEVRRVDAGILFVDMGGREVSYEPAAQVSLALAYACTVHKVQGSEFPAVVFVLHRGHHMLLSRPLLYTGLTRAKRLAVIIGDDVALARAAANAEQRRTHTRLAARLASQI
jgi:exodeoxyribonuclease V alpha subunit